MYLFPPASVSFFLSSKCTWVQKFAGLVSPENKSPVLVVWSWRRDLGAHNNYIEF